MWALPFEQKLLLSGAYDFLGKGQTTGFNAAEKEAKNAGSQANS